MKGKIRFYRIHLIAYDVLRIPRWSFPTRVPSPGPTPFVIRPRRLRKRFPCRIHLIRPSYYCRSLVEGNSIV